MRERNTCQILAGRLLEIRVQAGYQRVEDVDQMIEMIRAQISRVAEPTRVVIAADWRACRVLTPDVADRAIQMLTRTNPRVERSAILYSSDQATGVLQVLRIAREANLPGRRVFTSRTEMRDWLAEILDDAERARLELMLQA
jgi:hypothetical protein